MDKVNNRDCWPTREQELLLRAALLQDKDAIAAWEEWKLTADIEQIDPGSERLFPLLYHNLITHEIKDPLVGKLKAFYLRTWRRNQLLFYKTATLLRFFHTAGVQTMVLKGVALTALYYRDYGLRPMGDVDILVRTDKALEAIGLLRKLGWTPDSESPENLISVSHAVAFKNVSERAVDLHWHVLHESRRSDEDDNFWEGAVSISFNNVSTCALNPADQLLHVCAHGVKWNDVPPFHWVADAMTIINSAQIDWDRVISQSQNHRLVLPIRDALNYLRNKLDAYIPQVALRTIENMRTSKIECIEYNYRVQSYVQKPLGYLPIIWFDYSRSADNKSLPLKILGFIRYLQLHWNAKYLWQLPFYAIYMTIRRIKIIVDHEK
ncbi:MAG: nucleotidyltransferase family protein [Ignavibacteriales bacterium]